MILSCVLPEDTLYSLTFWKPTCEKSLWDNSNCYLQHVTPFQGSRVLDYWSPLKSAPVRCAFIHICHDNVSFRVHRTRWLDDTFNQLNYKVCQILLRMDETTLLTHREKYVTNSCHLDTSGRSKEWRLNSFGQCCLSGMLISRRATPEWMLLN